MLEILLEKLKMTNKNYYPLNWSIEILLQNHDEELLMRNRTNLNNHTCMAYTVNYKSALNVTRDFSSNRGFCI